ncbi:MAG: TIGR02206 family membrane protein [Alphaproteobacteria bacterium]|nr:TIGR02206 family membrane protein [Alphaproteobacteria bacterium]MBV9419075.1 TIGR02206 family membrane protein [Alphaproteobacteria bacterium]MBV9902973.1 TIGR02206 family membrane protein [Alphaproteobacteria bacterium]
MSPAPFALFGPSHLIALVLPFVLPPFVAWLVQPKTRPQLDRVLRWTLGAAMTVNWFGWMLMLHGKGWLGVDNEFPLNLCDWATVATVATLFWPNQRTFELAYFWALAGTLQGMLTPDVQLDYPDTQFLLFFVFHGGIIAGVLYCVFGLRMRPYPESIPRVIAWSFVYMGAAGLFDWLMGANYGLLRTKPPYPTILDAMPPWPWYLGVLVALAFVSIAIYYSPFFVIDQWRKRRSTQPASGQIVS